MKLLKLLPILITILTASSDGHNILAVLPFGAKSHTTVFTSLIEGLASQNQVTFITGFSPSKPLKNVDYIVVENSQKFYNEWVEFMSQFVTIELATTPFIKLVNVTNNGCIGFYEDPAVKNFQEKLLQKQTSYDAAIVMPFLSECYIQWVHSLQVPIILLAPFVMFPPIAWNLDVPYPTSCVALPVLPFNSTMNFRERLINMFSTYMYNAVFKWYITSEAEAVARRYVDSDVSVTDVLKYASLILVNSHISLDVSKPSMPNVVDVGGMHCRPGGKLPKEFEDFIAGSGDDGVIVMSMGSVVQGNRLPDEFTSLFKQVFAQVKQRVIWKYEGAIEGLSPNVMTVKWLPQQDLMAHPKCRLAITHGGLLSLQEVIYHGVPLLGVPLGADRDFNINQAVNKGFALILDWKNADANETLTKINSLIHDKQYKQRATELSILTRDRPQTPLETAVYWVEYVIRHKGAPHLKNAGAQQLNLIQYLGLDIIAFSLAICVTALFIVYKLIRALFRLGLRFIFQQKKVKKL